MCLYEKVQLFVNIYKNVDIVYKFLLLLEILSRIFLPVLGYSTCSFWYINYTVLGDGVIAWFKCAYDAYDFFKTSILGKH